MKNRAIFSLAFLCILLSMSCVLVDELSGESDWRCLDRSITSDVDLPVPERSQLSGKVAFISDRDDPNGEVYLYDFAKDSLVRLTNNDLEERDLAPSPDGSLLAFTASDALYVLDLGCVKTSQGCIQADLQLLASRVIQPDWTRWGIAVTWLFSEFTSSDRLSDIAVVDPGIGSLKPFGLGESQPSCGDCGLRKASQPVLNPAVSCMVYLQESLPFGKPSFSLQEFSFLLGIAQVGNCPQISITGEARDLAWMPDGLHLAWSDHGICVASASEAGTGGVSLWTPGQEAMHPAFSPEGEWMVFESELSGDWEVYVMAVPPPGTVNRAGKGQFNLSHSPQDDWGPVWLP